MLWSIVFKQLQCLARISDIAPCMSPFMHKYNAMNKSVANITKWDPLTVYVHLHFPIILPPPKINHQPLDSISHKTPWWTEGYKMDYNKFRWVCVSTLWQQNHQSSVLLLGHVGDRKGDSFITSSKNTWVLRRMCFSSVNSKKFFFNASAFWLTSRSSFSNFSKVASRSIISLGCGASGLSPVSSMGMVSFLISFSR